MIRSFPEVARKLATSGAEIILRSSAWSDLSHEMDWGAEEYRIFSAVRAMENTAFVVSSNRTGTEGKFSFVGQTRVIAPWGEILAERRQGEGYAITKVDLETLKRCRSAHPCLEEEKQQTPGVHL
jgi:predicted amidohydrolase